MSQAKAWHMCSKQMMHLIHMIIYWNAEFVVKESDSVKYFYLKTSAIMKRTQIQVR